MKVTFTNVDGTETRYLHAGQGEAVFLLHGIGMSGESFIRNIDALGEGFAVFAPDLLGHGFTASVDFGKAPPQCLMARHIRGLADALGIRSYSVAGTSYGALVAALMYFDAPERVRSAVLIGSGSVFHEAEEQKATLQAAAANGSRAMRDVTMESCRRRMAKIVYDPACVPEEILPIQMTSYARPDRLAAYEAAIAGSILTMDLPEARVYERLEALDLPVLVITGREDIRARWTAHVEGVERMPRARLVAYEKCGHMPFIEHPARFNADLFEFLSTDTGR
jgi:2-hydroxy-6-oxonona-2,4-dienedioate hydrolase